MKKIYIFIIYLVVSCIITYPLIFNLKSVLIGGPLDAYNYLWNIDTFWHEIFKLNNPFFTDRIFYPLGTSLIFHTYAPLVSLFGIFFLNNLVLYMNLLVISSLTLSSFSSFILIKYLTKNTFSGVIGGFIYGMSPIMISFLLSQHYYFAFAAPFLPLGVFLIAKYLETKNVKYILYFITIFVCCLLTDYYVSVMFILISFLFFFFNSNQKKLKIILLTLIPVFYLTTVLIFKSNTTVFRDNSIPYICSVKSIGFFAPSPANPFLSNLSQKLSTKFNYRNDPDTPSYFLGWGIVAMAFLGAFFNIRKKYVVSALTITIFFILFSMGPKYGVFAIISKLPFLGFINCPQRFPLAIQLGIATLVGFFASQIRSASYKKLLYGLSLIIIVIEYASFGLLYTYVSVPKIYKLISTYKDNYTVLELPSGIAETGGAFGYDWSIEALLTKQLYWQTIYKKPRIGGFISRLDHSYFDYFESEPVISDLFKMTSLNGEWDQKSFSDQEIDNFVKKFNLGYIVLSPNDRQTEFATVVENIFLEKVNNKIEIDGYVLYELSQ